MTDKTAPPACCRPAEDSKCAVPLSSRAPSIVIVVDGLGGVRKMRIVLKCRPACGTNARKAAAPPPTEAHQDRQGHVREVQG